jgi:hypothetical protein
MMMELLLVYYYKKIKGKTVELNNRGISFINLLFLLWAAGELIGFLLGYKLVSSWALRYLIGSSCGAGAGWFVYRKALSFERRSPDFFDLRQSKANPDDKRRESITKQANRSEDLKASNNSWTDSFSVQSGLQPIFDQNENRQSEKRPELRPEQKLESSSENKPEVKVRPEQTHESWAQEKPKVKVRTEYKPETDVGFRTPAPKTVAPAVPTTVRTPAPKTVAPAVPTTARTPDPKTVAPAVPTTARTPDPKTVAPTVPTTVYESVAATNRNIFHFPYSELVSINELLVGTYGPQTVNDLSISECQWFGTFKAKYEKQEIKAALMILENALCEDLTNGLIWLLFGVLYKDFYHDYDKALQFCLTGAKRCNTYKTALLTEAGELLLYGKKDLVNAIKFFSLAIVAITDVSRAWGNPNVEGCIAQERAFHFIRVLLTAFNFKDYRLYLERNIQFTTGMDQALIEKVLAICAEFPFRTEIEQQISRMFPLIIEKVQALG